MTEKQRQEAMEAAAWMRKRARGYTSEGLALVGDPVRQPSEPERLFVQAAWCISTAETLERSAKQ